MWSFYYLLVLCSGGPFFFTSILQQLGVLSTVIPVKCTLIKSTTNHGDNIIMNAGSGEIGSEILSVYARDHDDENNNHLECPPLEEYVSSIESIIFRTLYPFNSPLKTSYFPLWGDQIPWENEKDLESVNKKMSIQMKEDIAYTKYYFLYLEQVNYFAMALIPFMIGFFLEQFIIHYIKLPAGYKTIITYKDGTQEVKNTKNSSKNSNNRWWNHIIKGGGSLNALEKAGFNNNPLNNKTIYQIERIKMYRSFPGGEATFGNTLCNFMQGVWMFTASQIFFLSYSTPLYDIIYDNFRITDFFSCLTTPYKNVKFSVQENGYDNYNMPFNVSYDNMLMPKLEGSLLFIAFSWWFVNLAADFCFYWFHRACHQISWLWTVHFVHHSSEDYNLSVTSRLPAGVTNALTPLVFLMQFIPLAFLGIPQLYMTIITMNNFLYMAQLHTELVPPLPYAELIFNTASLHRVHHARNLRALSKNYAGIFALWDRIFGTFEPEDLEMLGLREEDEHDEVDIMESGPSGFTRRDDTDTPVYYLLKKTHGIVYSSNNLKSSLLQNDSLQENNNLLKRESMDAISNNKALYEKEIPQNVMLPVGSNAQDFVSIAERSVISATTKFNSTDQFIPKQISNGKTSTDIDDSSNDSNHVSNHFIATNLDRYPGSSGYNNAIHIKNAPRNVTTTSSNICNASSKFAENSTSNNYNSNNRNSNFITIVNKVSGKTTKKLKNESELPRRPLTKEEKLAIRDEKERLRVENEPFTGAVCQLDREYNRSIPGWVKYLNSHWLFGRRTQKEYYEEVVKVDDNNTTPVLLGSGGHKNIEMRKMVSPGEAPHGDDYTNLHYGVVPLMKSYDVWELNWYAWRTMIYEQQDFYREIWSNLKLVDEIDWERVENKEYIPDTMHDKLKKYEKAEKDLAFLKNSKYIQKFVWNLNKPDLLRWFEKNASSTSSGNTFINNRLGFNPNTPSAIAAKKRMTSNKGKIPILPTIVLAAFSKWTKPNTKCPHMSYKSKINKLEKWEATYLNLPWKIYVLFQFFIYLMFSIYYQQHSLEMKDNLVRWWLGANASIEIIFPDGALDGNKSTGPYATTRMQDTNQIYYDPKNGASAIYPNGPFYNGDTDSTDYSETDKAIDRIFKKMTNPAAGGADGISGLKDTIGFSDANTDKAVIERAEKYLMDKGIDLRPLVSWVKDHFSYVNSLVFHWLHDPRYNRSPTPFNRGYLKPDPTIYPVFLKDAPIGVIVHEHSGIIKSGDSPTPNTAITADVTSDPAIAPLLGELVHMGPQSGENEFGVHNDYVGRYLGLYDAKVDGNGLELYQRPSTKSSQTSGLKATFTYPSLEEGNWYNWKKGGVFPPLEKEVIRASVLAQRKAIEKEENEEKAEYRLGLYPSAHHDHLGGYPTAVVVGGYALGKFNDNQIYSYNQRNNVVEALVPREPLILAQMPTESLAQMPREKTGQANSTTIEFLPFNQKPSNSATKTLQSATLEVIPEKHTVQVIPHIEDGAIKTNAANSAVAIQNDVTAPVMPSKSAGVDDKKLKVSVSKVRFVSDPNATSIDVVPPPNVELPWESKDDETKYRDVLSVPSLFSSAPLLLGFLVDAGILVISLLCGAAIARILIMTDREKEYRSNENSTTGTGSPDPHTLPTDRHTPSEARAESEVVAFELMKHGVILALALLFGDVSVWGADQSFLTHLKDGKILAVGPALKWSMIYLLLNALLLSMTLMVSKSKTGVRTMVNRKRDMERDFW